MKTANLRSAKNPFKLLIVLYFIVLEIKQWSADLVEYTSRPLLNTTPAYFRNFLLEMKIYLKDQWEIELLLVLYKLVILTLMLYLSNQLLEQVDDSLEKGKTLF